MKPDEIFVQNCLVKSLNATNAWEGENPPDIYIEINKEKIAVEITRLSPISFDEKGNIQNRNSQDYFGYEICEDLNLKLRDEVPPDIDILLVLYMPVKNGRKFKKELYKYIKNFLTKDLKPGHKEEIHLLESRLKIVVIPNRTYSEKKIIGGIYNQNSNPHILTNAQIILENRIYDKINKCKAIKHKGPVWLALLNDDFLIDIETYKLALEKLNISHDFEKIYIVMDDGAVHPIY